MWGPISDDTVKGLVAQLPGLGISQRSRVLDLGCGPAELLRRVCEETGASGIGVDMSPLAIEVARRRIAASPARARIELHVGDATALDPDGSHDLAICIGPGWSTGGWTAMTSWASAFARAGGLLLLGDTAWRTDPPADALTSFGMSKDAYILAADVERTVSASGAAVAWSHRAGRDEWNAYADAYRSSMRRFVRDHPGEPITPAVRDRAEAGWSQYELLHELLDFVLVLARTA